MIHVEGGWNPRVRHVDPGPTVLSELFNVVEMAQGVDARNGNAWLLIK
jgi:hypothetical protein